MQKYLDKILNWIENSKLPVLTNPHVLKLIKVFLHAKFIRYLIIGFSSFGIQVAFYWIIFKMLDREVLSNAIAVFLTMTYNFVLSNYWTFKAGHGNHARKISKYLLLQFLDYIFNVVVFKILVVDLGVNAYLAMIMITGVIICWNFLLYRFWIFK